MTNSPQRLLFSGFIVCLLLGAALAFIGHNLSSYSNSLPSDDTFTGGSSLSTARYYWRTGRIGKAVEEYQRAIPTLPEEDRTSAYQELERLIFFDKSILGRITGFTAYYTWSLPLSLFLLAGLIALIFLGVVLYRRARKPPEFVIQPFYDRAGLNMGSDLPRIAIDRIHELIWRSENLEGISGLIADNIEIPTLSLMSEGDNQRAIELLEIALLFSVGATNLPFSHVVSAIKLWLDQPKYLVRGVFDRRSNTIILKMSLVDRKRNCIEKFWYTEIPPSEEPLTLKIVDSIIYPLLYHFNKIKASRWEALQALHIGLEEFQIFKENQSVRTHLESAQQQLEYAIELDPGYDLAKYNLSLFLLATGEFDRSKDYLRELSILSTDPQLRLRAKYNHGIALFHLSQDWAYEQATKIFQELLQQEDSGQLELLTHSALAMTYAKMARRRSKERESLVKKAVTQADIVIEEIQVPRENSKKLEENVQALDEALANAIAAKGFACMASKDYEQAIRHFHESIKINTRSIANSLGLGEAYALHNLKDEALDTFRKTSIQAPFSGYTIYRLGNLYRELGKFDEAIEVLKRAPHYAYARLVLGKIYLEQEEFESALEEFRQAVQLNSHLSEAWVNIAWTILQMEDSALMKEALGAARRSIQLEKNEKQLWHRHAIVALCLYQSKKNELALSAAQKAVERGPKQAQAYYYLALIQCELGQMEEARESIEKVRELDKKGSWMQKAARLLNQLK